MHRCSLVAIVMSLYDHVAELVEYFCSFANSCPDIFLCVSKARDIAAEVGKVFNVLNVMYI